MPQGMFQGIGDCQNRYSPLGNSLGTGQKVAYMRPARQRMTGSEQEQMDQLKLAALDQEDLQVLSAHLQDAVITIADIRYLPKEQKAVFLLNRFVWDKEADKRSKEHERRRTALAFAQVKAMKAQNINQKAKGAVLELLAVTFEPGEEPAGTIQLAFAGGGSLALEVDCIEAQLSDLGAAWSTPNLPQHDLS
ncbi:hypothetical protein LAL4801_03857 [Roseibium aggregatum]|uniref:DUF2948 family protein n=2 Tax=Roseibium aggregatum TaxID=187304 RepID=A0A0M6Y5N9_9HYPH|nr:hypothetical protein LAL4801_03857 [Roseibium aggregatum]